MIVLAGAVVLGGLGCSASAPQTSGEHACPVAIELSSNVFDNAGLVRPTFKSPGVTEILIPRSGGFKARRVSDSPASPRQAVRYRGIWDPYSLTIGMPSTAWHSVGRTIDALSYEVPPGRYEIVLMYRIAGSRETCVTASTPFVLNSPTLFFQTD